MYYNIFSKFTVTSSSNSFNYAELLLERFHNQWKDVVTTQPDSLKLIHSQNILDEIPDRNTTTKP